MEFVPTKRVWFYMCINMFNVEDFPVFYNEIKIQIYKMIYFYSANTHVYQTLRSHVWCQQAPNMATL